MRVLVSKCARKSTAKEVQEAKHAKEASQAEQAKLARATEQEKEAREQNPEFRILNRIVVDRLMQ